MEVVGTMVTIIHVIVTMVLVDQAVKQLIIAITRTVLVTEHVITNTTRTHVHVIRDIQELSASILTVTIMDVKIMQRVSMDTLTIRVHVYQDIWVIYVKRRIFVTIRNAPDVVHVKMEDQTTHVHVMLGI